MSGVTKSQFLVAVTALGAMIAALQFGSILLETMLFLAGWFFLAGIAAIVVLGAFSLLRSTDPVQPLRPHPKFDAVPQSAEILHLDAFRNEREASDEAASSSNEPSTPA